MLAFVLVWGSRARLSGSLVHIRRLRAMIVAVRRRGREWVRLWRDPPPAASPRRLSIRYAQKRQSRNLRQHLPTLGVDSRARAHGSRYHARLRSADWTLHGFHSGTSAPVDRLSPDFLPSWCSFDPRVGPFWRPRRWVPQTRMFPTELLSSLSLSSATVSQPNERNCFLSSFLSFNRMTKIGHTNHFSSYCSRIEGRSSAYYTVRTKVTFSGRFFFWTGCIAPFKRALQLHADYCYSIILSL